MAVRLLAPRGSDGSDFVPIDKAPMVLFFYLEQATGIEPATSAWEANVLPLNYACSWYLI